MSRSDSVKLHLGTPKSRCGVRLPENCYAPIAYKCIVIHHCYDQTLTANARVGTGNFCDPGRDRLIRIEKSGRKTGYILLMRKCSGKPQNVLPASFNVGEEMLWTIGRKTFWRINHFLNANRQQGELRVGTTLLDILLASENRRSRVSNNGCGDFFEPWPLRHCALTSYMCMGGRPFTWG